VDAHDANWHNLVVMPKRDKSLTQFGRNVSRLRNTGGFSQGKLAEKADLDRTYISGIEPGVRNP